MKSGQDGRADLVDGREDLQDGSRDLLDRRKDLLDGREDLQDGREDLLDGRELWRQEVTGSRHGSRIVKGQLKLELQTKSK